MDIATKTHTTVLLEMRHTDPKGLATLRAEKRVERGIDWLLKNAPFGWRRNLFQPLPQEECRRRFRDSFDNECVLALAFESRRDCANRYGYVTYASATNEPGLSNKTARLPGFCGDLCGPGPSRVTSEILDEVWDAKLTGPEWHNIPVRYLIPEQEARRQEVLSYDFSLPPEPKGWWGRLLERLSLAFSSA